MIVKPCIWEKTARMKIAEIKANTDPLKLPGILSSEAKMFEDLSKLYRDISLMISLSS